MKQLNQQKTFNPKYKVFLKSKCFHCENFVCLGTQLISIVHSLKSFLPPHIWYGTDIDAIGKGAGKHDHLESIKPNLIGTDSQLIEYCTEIDQFIWGVFLCIDNKFSPPNILDIEVETEDKAFRSIPCDGILLEIKAFDTTFFEIYSEDIELIKKIAELYSVQIERKGSNDSDQ